MIKVLRYAYAIRNMATSNLNIAYAFIIVFVSGKQFYLENISFKSYSRSIFITYSMYNAYIYIYLYEYICTIFKLQSITCCVINFKAHCGVVILVLRIFKLHINKSYIHMRCKCVNYPFQGRLQSLFQII